MSCNSNGKLSVQKNVNISSTNTKCPCPPLKQPPFICDITRHQTNITNFGIQQTNAIVSDLCVCDLQGVTGEKGEVGPPGPTGEKGEVGPTGICECPPQRGCPLFVLDYAVFEPAPVAPFLNWANVTNDAALNGVNGLTEAVQQSGGGALYPGYIPQINDLVLCIVRIFGLSNEAYTSATFKFTGIVWIRLEVTLTGVL